MRITTLGCFQIGTIIRLAVASASLVAFSATPVAAANIFPGAWQTITTIGAVGTLRAGSIWAPGGTLGAQSSIVDDVFLTEPRQWDDGSWWWDEDPSVNAVPVVTTIKLHELYTIDELTVQADDNDTYRIEYWNGAAWVLAWDIPAVGGPGLVTRSSGLLPAFSTDELRFTATGGDNYYSVSEIQAEGFATRVPEPSTMLLLGTGVIGAGARRWRKRRQ